MSATLGLVVSGIALVLGVAAFVTGEGWARERVGRRAALDILGTVLCVGGVVWLLLSIAAYRGD
jgi:hypothetical protein